MRTLSKFLLLALLLWSSAAHAVLKVNITQGKMEPLPIALPRFANSGGDTAEFAENIIRTASADLERSGLFRPIDSRAFLQEFTDASTLPQFASWRQIDSSALVTGAVRNAGNGQLEVEFRLWDVFTEEQIAGRAYTTTKANWRRIAHLIADEIYARLTGETGYFDTRIVYVAESGPGLKRIKRLAIMDQDGANHRYLTDGSHLVLTPRFSPNSQKIIYFSYASKTPRVFLYDLETGKEFVVGDFPGMTYAPRFSPDGKSIIMSLATDGSSNIYNYDLSSRQKHRLTSGPNIDTSPSYSPNGQRITFNSDRGGAQQLYVMNADGSDLKRISFGKGKYGTPVWSPREDLIAFTKIFNGMFYIGVMKPDGSSERLITEGYLVEGPTWSPNGRVIMYARETKTARGDKTTKIYSIDITGYNEREVVTPLEASDPAWSPLRQ